MNLKLTINSLILLLGLLYISCNQPKEKPNVIFVLTDDLGWKDLTCYGSKYYETPNIDALARDGVSFTNHYAASPLCSPTRASVLTGLKPGRLRFTMPTGHIEEVILDPQENTTAASFHKTATPDTKTRLENEYLTFAEVFKENGYSTAFMGKWHLGREPYIPENQGFDHVVGGREHPGPPGPGRFFSPWDCETLPVVPEGTHITDIITDSATTFINRSKDHPFLLCLWFYDVHAPYQAKEKLIEKYQKKLGSDNIQRSPIMGGMIDILDSSMGRVIQALKDADLYENTIIVFTSDNGGNMYDGPDNTTPTNNSPLRGGKGNNYEGGVRVPLIVRVPGLTKAGTVSNTVVSSIDYYSTLLELVKIPFPENIKTDGFSFVRALKGEEYERPPNFSTFCHNVVATGNRANISVRHGPWKLYKFYYDGPDRTHRFELYNLNDDIGETKNLSIDQPEIVTKMEKMIDDHVAESEILLPRLNENYAGNVADAWVGSRDIEISVKNNSLFIKSIGKEPFIKTVYTPNLEGDLIMEFDMKSTQSGNGKVSWTAGKNAGDSAPFNVIVSAGWEHYSIPITVTNTLNSLTIFPLDRIGDLEIKNVTLLNKEGYYLRDWPITYQ